MIVPTVVAFTPSCLPICPVTHPSLVQVYNFIPDVLKSSNFIPEVLTFSPLGHCGEVGVCLIECVDRCILYR